MLRRLRGTGSYTVDDAYLLLSGLELRSLFLMDSSVNNSYLDTGIIQLLTDMQLKMCLFWV